MSSPSDSKFQERVVQAAESALKRHGSVGPLELFRPPELVVFQKVSEEGNCSECGLELPKGEFLFKEKGKLLCLACADLDQLVFLPAGDAALSRRWTSPSRLTFVMHTRTTMSFWWGAANGLMPAHWCARK